MDLELIIDCMIVGFWVGLAFFVTTRGLNFITKLIKKGINHGS